MQAYAGSLRKSQHQQQAKAPQHAEDRDHKRKSSRTPSHIMCRPHAMSHKLMALGN